MNRMDNIIINKDSDFRNETISSVPLGINNLKIDTNDKNFDLKIDDINNNIKPMLSGGSNTITIPDGKKYKLKPNLNKKVPINTFSMMANNKKNLGNNSSGDESSYESSNSNESVTDEILSNEAAKALTFSSETEKILKPYRLAK